MISKEQQTVMEILYSEDYSADSFILNKYNHDAFVAIAIQTAIGYRPYPNILIINGSKFSGKTHLMHIWQKTYNAKFLDALFCNDALSKLNSNQLKSLSTEMLFEHAKHYIQNSYCILEDIETIEELTLLTIINMMIDSSSMQFVLTANTWPINIKLQDLKDRLNSIKQVNILQPDLEMLRIIIIRYFRVRSIKVDEKTISYLTYRLPSDLNLVKQILDDINHRSLIAKTNISIKFLERIYNGEF